MNPLVFKALKPNYPSWLWPRTSDLPLHWSPSLLPTIDHTPWKSEAAKAKEIAALKERLK